MLRELFERVLKEYKTARNENFTGHPIANILRNEIPEELKQIIENSDKYKVSGSAGQGNWTYSPWVAIMDKEITESPQKGYYLVYLFREDMNGLYLSLNQGMTEIKNQYGANKTKEILRSKTSEFREKLGEYPELLETINLKAINSSSNSIFYEEGNIYAKYYDLQDLPSNDVFINDLRMFLDLYDSIVVDNMSLELAVAKVKESYKHSGRKKDEEEVIEKYGNMFHPSNLDNLTRDDFKSFLIYQNNKHWTGLHRRGSDITKDMDRLKNCLQILLNENLPLEERLDTIFPKDKHSYIKYLGRAIITPILMVVYPQKYGVYNNISEKGLKKVGLEPEFSYGASFSEKYIKVNEVFKNLARKYDLSLFELDEVWDAIVRERELTEIESVGNFYWVTVGKNLQVNYHIGIENGIWAVKDNYVNKLENVNVGDYVLFYGNSIGFALCKVEKEHFLDHSKVWHDDIYSNRIKISKPIYEGNISTEDVRNCLIDANDNPYGSVRAWASSIRGGGGVFRKLKDQEIECLFNKLNWRFPPESSQIEYNSFTEFLSAKGFYFKPETIENFLLSIKAKPFVVLTGNSGTGKTKIAQLFCEYLELNNGECHKIIPVGANWTENRHIVGFYNVITNEYMKSDALDIILEARKSENEDKPFFLILDEMNLSHVERYFADFLSAMESDAEISLHKSEDEENKEDGEGVPRSVKIPKNLFVIGTVNVDETTYMFSPKVLDRANVIEFSTIPAKNYMINGLNQDELNGDHKYLEDPLFDHEFDKSIRKSRIEDLKGYLKDVKTEDGRILWDVLSDELNKFQEVLKKAGFDFGFRVIDEILRYMYVAWYYEGEHEEWSNWNSYFDAQIKQKMLPKIHGSQRTLENVIKELFNLCLIEKSEILPRNFGDVISNEDVHYHSSALKLQEMDKILYNQRYVAFIN